MDLGLQGTRVLVTAASQGLGAATARRFSMEGAQVVICSRSLEKLQDTAAAINAESTVEVLGYPCVAKSYPDFFEDFGAIGGQVDE